MNSSKDTLTRINLERTVDRSLPAMVPQATPIWIDSGGHRVSLASYLEIPFMHKRLIIVCTLVGMLAAWLAILLWPRSYASEAKLTMRVGRESVSLDPTATMGTTISLQKTREEEIVTALEMLSSRQITELVVDELGAEAIINGILPGTGLEPRTEDSKPGLAERINAAIKPVKERATDKLNQVLLAAGIKNDISNRELAIRKLLSSVHVHSPVESRVINIEARAKTSTMAQAIVEAITENFLNEHLDTSYTEGSLEFFQQQARETENRLDELVRLRRDYMQEHKIVSIEANRELLREQLAGIDRDLVSNYGDLEQALAESEDLELKTNEADDEIVAEKIDTEDETWSGMRQLVYELELEEQEASAAFTENHPRLRRIRKQLEGARKILADRESNRVDMSTTPNPVKVGLGVELQRQQTAIAGLKSEIQEKEQRRAAMQKEIDALLEQERHLTQLDREILLLGNNLASLEEKLEEARVIDELHDNRISNIDVFQPATFIERAVSPDKRLLAAGFLLLGLTSGLFLSVLKEGSSPTLRTAGDVEKHLVFPVVAELPRISRMSSPRLKDQRLVRRKCQELITDVLLSKPRPDTSRGRSLGILSVDAGSGASTLAMNLAATASLDCHMKTVLVDADSRHRSISKMFGLNGAPGLVELLQGSASHDECLQKVKDTSVELIASAADGSRELLSNTAPEIIQALQAYLHECDLLIVDLPAANQPDQAVALAQHLDSVLVVVESEKTEMDSAERLLRRLAASETDVVGVVLNKTRDYLPRVVRSFVTR